MIVMIIEVKIFNFDPYPIFKKLKKHMHNNFFCVIK